MTSKKLSIVLFVFLTACAAHENGWAPTIDIAKDPRADMLQSDLAGCRQLAEHTGEKDLTQKTRSKMITDDGVMINGSAFRHSYINCMKERKHPVVD